MDLIKIIISPDLNSFLDLSGDVMCRRKLGLQADCVCIFEKLTSHYLVLLGKARALLQLQLRIVLIFRLLCSRVKLHGLLSGGLIQEHVKLITEGRLSLRMDFGTYTPRH